MIVIKGIGIVKDSDVVIVVITLKITYVIESFGEMDNCFKVVQRAGYQHISTIYQIIMTPLLSKSTSHYDSINIKYKLNPFK